MLSGDACGDVYNIAEGDSIIIILFSMRYCTNKCEKTKTKSIKGDRRIFNDAPKKENHAIHTVL